MPLTPERSAKLSRVAQQRQQGILVLEDIHDPHNAAACFRTCDAFGFQEVWLVFEKETAFDPRLIGKATSTAANKWIDFRVFDSLNACFEALDAEAYETVATAIGGDAESLWSAHFTQPKTALLMGNEKRGLSEQALIRAKRRITIPMRGMCQSLNLSVTTAILLHELTRQRNAQGMDGFLLPVEERAQLEQSFKER